MKVNIFTHLLKFNLYVVEGNGPPNWEGLVGLDLHNWKSFDINCYGEMCRCPFLIPMTPHCRLYAEVFDEHVGMIKEFKTWLRVKDNSLLIIRKLDLSILS